MVKLSHKFSKSQISAAIACVLMIVACVVFGIFVRCSYARVSLDSSAYANAKVSFEQEYAEYLDYNMTSMDFETARSILDEYDYIFKVKCKTIEHCYSCTKYVCSVLETVKGDSNESGKDIVLYQWNWFESDKDGLSFCPTDDMMPMKSGSEYLVFAAGKDYCAEYQRTLDKNEYSIGLNYVPTIYILNKTQTEPIDINNDTVYSSLDEKYYLCFSREALNNANKLSKQITEYYLNIESK